MPTAAPVCRPPLEHDWIFPEPPDPASAAALERLAAELNLPPHFCQVLVGRGYGDPAAARAYLRPHAGQLHSPWLLAGMEAAVGRLARAIRGGETILVHGDYDVDGVCAAALYTRTLKMMGARVRAWVPHRLRDGYDLSEAGVRAAREVGATLILTGDCGVLAHAAVGSARKSGIEVIVTDHHTPGPCLPPAAAVVNPNRRDCEYPEKGLAGAGVAYKVCSALAERLGSGGERLASVVDLVAVATIADLAPLTRENRSLVRWGLKVLARTPNPGLRALIRACGLDPGAGISAGQVGFILAPRINAAGRMGSAMRALRLLLTDSEAEAAALAERLELENRARRKVEAETVEDALRMLDGFDPARERGVVLASDRWHPGVIGIVASRIVEQIHRPTVLVAMRDGEGKGSGRSIGGYNLYEGLLACAEHLVRFGGHAAAAGCVVAADRLEQFRRAFDQHAAAVLQEHQLRPKLRIDLELPLEIADHRLCRLLEHAAPFGVSNPTPLFAARDLSLAAPPRVVGDGHLKLLLRSGPATLEAIGFRMADPYGPLIARAADDETRLDAAFKLEERTWKGKVRVQGRLVGLRPTTRSSEFRVQGSESLGHDPGGPATISPPGHSEL